MLGGGVVSFVLWSLVDKELFLQIIEHRTPALKSLQSEILQKKQRRVGREEREEYMVK